MTKEDILRLRDTAEQTRVQFKERVTRDNKYDVSCEMVAQSNSRGGMIVVATVKQGKNKPYRDSKGIVWVKQGADKRLHSRKQNKKNMFLFGFLIAKSYLCKV
jgi:predicted HTH transcriptional regulator